MRSVFAISVVTLALAVGVNARQAPAQQQGQRQQGQAQGRAGGRGPMPAPSNLQVLPKDWTGQQVAQFMRTYFTVGLGVQCGFCHVQDRSSDEKPEKVTARKMLAMVMTINNDILKDVGMPAKDNMKVTCYTCHRGDKTPLTIPPAAGGGGGQ